MLAARVMALDGRALSHLEIEDRHHVGRALLGEICVLESGPILLAEGSCWEFQKAMDHSCFIT